MPVIIPKLLFLLFAVGYNLVSYGQSKPVATVPRPDALKQAVALDIGGNTPVLGVSYHHQLLRLTGDRPVDGASLDLVVGVGYVPAICLFGCNQGGVSTHHALLVRWGRRFQGEAGYAGVLAAKQVISQQAYLPGLLAGARYAAPGWFVRLYLAGLVHHYDNVELINTGNVVVQRYYQLGLATGLSVGKRF